MFKVKLTHFVGTLSAAKITGTRPDTPSGRARLSNRTGQVDPKTVNPTSMVDGSAGKPLAE
jgi:hypothetical protein